MPHRTDSRFLFSRRCFRFSFALQTKPGLHKITLLACLTQQPIIPNIQGVAGPEFRACDADLRSISYAPRQQKSPSLYTPLVSPTIASSQDIFTWVFFMAWRIPRLPSLSDHSSEITPDPCRRQRTWNCLFIPSFFFSLPFFLLRIQLSLFLFPPVRQWGTF